MSRWFRFYDESLNNRKVQSLPPELFKHWINILCIASKHGGVLPSLAEVSFGLRLSEAKAAIIVAALAKRALLDPVEGGYFRPHDWDTRQYKSDVSNERVQRHRKRKRNVTCNVTSPLPETPPETDTDTDIDDDEDARARPPLISAEANRLADEVAKLAGHDTSFVPPSWCGAAYRAQQWLNQGWPEELILLSVREQAAKKRDGPAKSIQYFEPGIASAIARANQPLPNIVEIPAKTVEVSSAKTTGNSAAAAAKRLEAAIQRKLAEDGLDHEPYQPTYLRLPAG